MIQQLLKKFEQNRSLIHYSKYLVVFFTLFFSVLTIYKIKSSYAKGMEIHKALPYLYITIVFLILFATLVMQKIVSLWLNRRKGIKGSKLHLQLIMTFTLTGLVPSACVAIFSTWFFNASFKTLFSDPLKQTIESASSIADRYMEENRKTIEADAFGIAMQLRPILSSVFDNTDVFNDIITELSEQRGLSEALIFDKQRRVIARSYYTFSLIFEQISKKDIFEAETNGIVIIAKGNTVRALIPLDPVSETYLFIGKRISNEVIDATNKAKQALGAYTSLELQQGNIQLTFILFFTLVIALLVLGSGWAGISLANSLYIPISRLIDAAEQVSQGSLDTRISEISYNNEFDNLIKAFNRMTVRLKEQSKIIAISERKAAWSDVARKIAHEIKNPLTPIQLSAERLKRRYKKMVAEDDKVFSNCVDTIIRQVNNIGNLVNEFSSFARMPEPKFENCNLSKIIIENIELQKNAYQNISFEFNGPETLPFNGDKQQISQVVMNLLQNSINILREKMHPQPSILVEVFENNNNIEILVHDNGTGFNPDNLHQLTQPYYTSRKNGTGLGLAIVEKIVQDHNGKIYFSHSDILHGALVKISFSRTEK